MMKAVAGELPEAHRDLVDKMVKMARRRFGTMVEDDDLRSFAFAGLVSATRNFNPELGVPFEPYAVIRIKGAIHDGISEIGWLPRRLHRQVAFYKRADELLEAHRKSDTLPPDSLETATRALGDRLKELTSVYMTTYAAETNESASVPAEAEYTAEHNRYRTKMMAYLGTLSEVQQEVVRRHFFEDTHLAEIAEEMGHTKSWASRVLKAALKNLRSSFEDIPGSLEDFQPG